MTALRTVEITMDTPSKDPGYANIYQFCYPKYSSPKTEQYQSVLRTVAWATGRLYEGRKMWVLYSWTPLSGLLQGRLLNFHCHPNFGGYEPDNSTGVSPIAIDLFGSSNYASAAQGTINGMLLIGDAEGGRTGVYNKRWQIFSYAEMQAALTNGTRLDLVLEVDIGYTNGRVKVWRQGVDTPIVDTGLIATHWPSQQAYAVWDGMYNSNGNAGFQKARVTAPRIGRTLAEALLDIPATEVALDGGVDPNNNSILRHSRTVVTSLDDSAFLMPASLGGGGVPGGPDPSILPDTVHGWGFRSPSGATSVAYGYNNKRAALFTAPDTRDITAIWVYQGAGGSSGTVNRRFFISATDGNSPINPAATLVTATPVALNAGDAMSWRRIPLPAPFRWGAGEQKFVGFQTDSGTGDAVVNGYNTSAAGDRHAFAADTYSDGLASPFGTPADVIEARSLFFMEGEVVSPSDPNPGPIYRLSSLARTAGVRTIAPSGHFGGDQPGGGI